MNEGDLGQRLQDRGFPGGEGDVDLPDVVRAREARVDDHEPVPMPLPVEGRIDLTVEHADFSSCLDLAFHPIRPSRGGRPAAPLSPAGGKWDYGDFRRGRQMRPGGIWALKG
ncbi:MAG: hypothetical protein M0C28_40120 [Candidatus Moduliflexus flocculans]|nr:hypothetical protein [Candidatus Moduliflexus flocculans]